MTQNLINIEDPSIFIYRFEELHWLLESFRVRKLVLRSPTTWDDHWENFLYKNKAKIKSTGELAGLAGVFDRLYGQSWTLLSNDSDLIWRLFSPKGNRVRIRTTPANLLQAIWDSKDPYASMSYFVGSVTYGDEKEIASFMMNSKSATSIILDNKGLNQPKMLLVKRAHFRHEQEFRVICFDHERKRSDGKNCIIDADPCCLYDELLFDPRFKPWEFKYWEKVFLELGYSKSIQRSTIYEFTPLEIEIDA